jgi:hypothetical protein
VYNSEENPPELSALSSIKKLTEENSEAIRKSELNKELIKLSENQDENEQLELKILELQKQKKILDKNTNFINLNKYWLDTVAGIIGLDNISELYTVDASGFYELDLKLISAKQHAISLLKSKINPIDDDVLMSDFNFLNLLSLYYIKSSNSSKNSKFEIIKQNYIEKDIENLFYKIIKSRVNSSQLNRVLLGDLANCSEDCSC